MQLFIREGKRLHLSAEGKLLLDYADRLLDLAQEAREAVQDAKPRGLLRLGSMESTASVRLPVPMNEYLTRYPEVSLELRIGAPRELATAVREGELDAALVAEPIPDAPFEKIPLYDEELVIIAGAKHPPIKSPRDANGQPVLAFEAGCPYRQRLDDWFAKQRRDVGPHHRDVLLPRHARAAPSPAWASRSCLGSCSRHSRMRSCSACIRCRRGSVSLRRSSSGARARSLPRSAR